MPPSKVVCIDASALLDLLLDLPRAAAVSQVVADAEMVAPDVVNIEILNALRRKEWAGQISTERTAKAVAAFVDAPLQRLPTTDMLEAAWSLRANLTPADACYVVAARALGVPLLTADLRLARAPGLGVPVIVV